MYIVNVLISAPIKLYGEGNYALTDVKEIKVTDDFLDLDIETRKCQHKEAFEDCTTRQHLYEVQMKCHCVPYNIKDFSNKDQVEIFCLSLIFNQILIMIYERNHN